MKKYFFISLLLLTSVLFPASAHSQTTDDTVKVKTKKMVVIEKNDGIQFVGELISQDAREVIIKTAKMGEIAIPKHEIKSIKDADPEEFNQNGEYIPNEVFSTRYFITTNGLPIEKGESYIQWNIFGPDFQFGVRKNFSLGIMTSWIGMPIIGTAKYSVKLGKKANLGIGTLLGTGSWIKPDFFMALPFTALTIGDRKANLNLAMGYGLVSNNGYSEGRFVMSIGMMAKVSRKVSIVFDSFMMPNIDRNSGWSLLVPGLRFQTDSKKAFQFGFGGLVTDGEVIPIPLPFVQWFQKF
jgi:hypothetical protein